MKFLNRLRWWDFSLIFLSLLGLRLAFVPGLLAATQTFEVRPKLTCRCSSNLPIVNCPMSAEVTCREDNTGVVKWSGTLAAGQSSSFTYTASNQGRCDGVDIPGYRKTSSCSIMFSSSTAARDCNVSYSPAVSGECPVVSPTPAPSGNCPAGTTPSGGLYSGTYTPGADCLSRFGEETPNPAACLNKLPDVTPRSAADAHSGVFPASTPLIAQKDALTMKVWFCTGIKAMTDYERQFGRMAYFRFTNTVQLYNLHQNLPGGGTPPKNFHMDNFRLGVNRPTPTSIGNVDIDWFNDVSIGRVLPAWISYPAMKTYWNIKRNTMELFGSDDREARFGFPLPYSDSKETTAVTAVGEDRKFQDLWPYAWIQQNCGACGYDKAMYDIAMNPDRSF